MGGEGDFSRTASGDAVLARNSVSHYEAGSGLLKVSFNPIVTGVAVVIIWGFVFACIAEPDYMRKGLSTAAFDWIREVWTWLYIMSQDVWIVILVYLMIPEKYAKLKLGRDDEQPAYSFATWFSLLFSAGVAVGLFYYSVYEPLYHYNGGHARWQHETKRYGTDNEDAVHAIMITWFHWGVHGWVPYTTMGALLGIMCYRRGFPMSIRYCFYPLIGEATFGWIGDLVDTISIVTTIFGVCTSLGMGVMQINAGMQRLNYGYYQGTNYALPANTTLYDPTCGGTGHRCEYKENDFQMQPWGIQTNVETQLLIIVIVTAMATASVVSGMNFGIVTLSRINFGLGMFILLFVLFLGETYFCLNAVTQVFGYYLWYLPKISFHTDAFEGLGLKDMGLGGAPDNKSGSSSWMDGWTLFYWGWWISWGPFVGTFIAKISRGRTLRQFIMGTLIVPSLYGFFWFGVFGAEGIRMQRMAEASGLCDIAKQNRPDYCMAEGNMRSPNCVNYAGAYNLTFKIEKKIGFRPDCVLDPVFHNGFGKCQEFEWRRKTEAGDSCVDAISWVSRPCGNNPDPTAYGAPPEAGPCRNYITITDTDVDSPRKTFNHFPPEKNPPCFVPAPDNLVCLSRQSINEAFFDLMSSYGPRGFSDMACIVSMIALIMYFVTSSDSGSYVVDMISANGDEDPPIIQRVFWSVTEGATACALLYAGKNLSDPTGALTALQCASLFMGLPYTFILFWCSQALVLAVKEEAKELDYNRKNFQMFLLRFDRMSRLLVNTIAPGPACGRIVEEVGGWPLHGFSPQLSGLVHAVGFQGFWLCAIIVALCGYALYQWLIVGLVLYCGYGVLVGALRTTVRGRYGIVRSDIFTDLVCGVCVPMFTITQLEVEIAYQKSKAHFALKAKEEAAEATMYGSPADPAKSWTVTFEPGSLGVEADWAAGVVTAVTSGGQGDRKGVRQGMTIVTVDDQPYAETVLDRAISGSKAYKVSLQSPKASNAPRRDADV